MKYRTFDLEKDKESVFRIFNECGWVQDKKKDYNQIKFLSAANTLIHDVNGEAEVMTNSSIGTIRYQNETLTLSAITGVIASLLARKQGFASKLTAIRLALDAENGAEVAVLCIFDQGYYNKLGFGNGSYEQIVNFTPSTLNIKRKPKTPVRLSEKDYKKIHKNRVNRMPCHGSIVLPEFITLPVLEKTETVCFGYFDNKGNLTHHILLKGKGKEKGPVWIDWMAYENLDQLMDLLAFLKSFEEQFLMIQMVEPPFINMQDFIHRPFQKYEMTEKSEFHNHIYSKAFWQVRILDLEKCVSKTHLKCDDFSFNLELTDPIKKYIPEEITWKGIAGNYVVSLGKNSSAKKEFKKGLPILKASVDAFTRMWLGILPASSLVYSDGIEAPKNLLEKLDNAFHLPKPHIDWDF